jgi:hypothetical protein
MILDAPTILVGFSKIKQARRIVIEKPRGAPRSKKHPTKINWVGGEGFAYFDKTGKEKGQQLRPFAVPLLCSIIGPGARIAERYLPHQPKDKHQRRPRCQKTDNPMSLPIPKQYKLILPPCEANLDFETETDPTICLESILIAAINRFITLHGGKSQYKTNEYIAGRFLYLQLLAQGISIPRLTTRNLRETLTEQVIIETARKLLATQTDLTFETRRHPPDIICTTLNGFTYSWNELLPKLPIDELAVNNIRSGDEPIDIHELAEKYLQHFTDRSGVTTVLVEVTTRSGKKVSAWAHRGILAELPTDKTSKLVSPPDIKTIESECFGESFEVIQSGATTM